MAVIRKLTIYQGEDIEIPFSVVDDITDWTIVFSLKKSYATSYNDSINFLQVDAVIVDAASGQFKASLTSAQTMRTPGNYVYDVTRIDAGHYTVMFTGQFLILSDVNTGFTD